MSSIMRWRSGLMQSSRGSRSATLRRTREVNAHEHHRNENGKAQSGGRQAMHRTEDAQSAEHDENCEPDCEARPRSHFGLRGSSLVPSGRLRSRFPVVAKMAFATAGAITGVPGSPTPRLVFP
jgi:hypothetical protein